MYTLNLPILFSSFLVLFFASCKQGANQGVENSQSIDDCVACERISLFYNTKDLVDSEVWNGLSDASHIAPLLYYTDTTTYIAFSDNELFTSDTNQIITCESGVELKKLYQRLDEQPFHMENKMNFKDTTSLFYFRPLMLCSDVETMHKFVPDFDKTEDWLQLVMHEYFHSFQFSHVNTINYFAHTIQMSADTLNNIYKDDKAFQNGIKNENQLLLSAIETKNKDSLNYYVNEFHAKRSKRRIKFENRYSFNISTAESFWETIEGTARYTESYMPAIFSGTYYSGSVKCDTLFQNFAEYSDLDDFEYREEFNQRTKIMPAYYYVTGFNLCRLMDKLEIDYKKGLFEKPQIGLYEIFLKASH